MRLLHIEKILEAKPYKLKVEFDNGETKYVDFEKIIRSKAENGGLRFAQLLEPDYFANVKINPEWRSIYWENGLDFCPDTMYMWALEQENKNGNNNTF